MATSSPQLCISVQRSQSSIARGHAAKYALEVWTTNGGTATSVAVKLAAQPSGQKATFIGSSTVGTIDPTKPFKDLQAQIQVASNANSVTSVKLTATATAKGVNPGASTAPVSVSVTAAPKPSSSPTNSPSSSSSTALPTGSPTGTIPGSTSTIPAVGLPSLNGSGSTLSPGGSVSGLFPTINPSSGDSPTPGQANGDPKGAQPVADSATLPLGAPVAGAQVVGLVALALALILAITRLSIRKRPATKQPPGK